MKPAITDYFSSSFFILLCLGAFTSCTTADVYTSYSKTTDFNKYQSYAILNEPVKDSMSMFTDPSIRLNFENSIRDEMDYRGLSGDIKNPDMLIRYYSMVLKIDRKTLAQGNGYLGKNYPDSVVLHNGNKLLIIRNRPPKNRPLEIVSGPYEKEILFIDLIDRAQQEIIWKGWGIENLESLKDAFGEAPWTVKKMMRLYPVKYKKKKELEKIKKQKN